jgi:fructose-specific phosphotransferase system IIC component
MGCLIPLLTLIVYLTVSSSLSIDSNLNFLVVVLIATLVGMVSILLLLYWLLYPITLTSTTLHKYLNEEEN